jgi:NADPH2:quinone reductase
MLQAGFSRLFNLGVFSIKAMILAANGGVENFHLRDIPIPPLGANQILVRVLASSVNPVDAKLRKTGAFGYGPGSVLGFDVAGKVEKVGTAVTDFHPADDVYYSPAFGLPGSYAEFNIVESGIAAKKPSGLSWIEAAAVPLAGMTAYGALFDRANLRLGQTVLIINSTGGVGSFATQLAHRAGAHVIAVCSGPNMALARSLGADRVIDRSTEDVVAIVREEHPDGVDLVLDCAGFDWIARCMDIVRPMGQMVTIVNPSGDLAIGYRKNVTLHYSFLCRSRRTLEQLTHLIDRNLLKPVINKVFRLEEVADAHNCLEQGGGFGKIGISIGS